MHLIAFSGRESNPGSAESLSRSRESLLVLLMLMSLFRILIFCLSHSNEADSPPFLFSFDLRVQLETPFSLLSLDLGCRHRRYSWYLLSILAIDTCYQYFFTLILFVLSLFWPKLYCEATIFKEKSTSPFKPNYLEDLERWNVQFLARFELLTSWRLVFHHRSSVTVNSILVNQTWQ